MRSAVARSLALVVVLTVFSLRLPAADDLRDQFGTSSSAAAKAAADGIRLVKEHKASEALPALETALKEDPNFQLAYYWKAMAQVDTGDVEPALATYQKLLAVAERTKVTNITVDACINAGLMLAKIKRDKESRLWFSRAITLDPADNFHLHGKAYRNMSISCHLRDEHASAAMCAFAGYLADPQRVKAQMVLDFLNKTDKEEVARVLAFDDPVPTVAARDTENALGSPMELQGIAGSVSQLLVDPAANRIVAVGTREAKYYVIDCGRRNEVKAVEAAGEIAAASLAGGELYLSVRPSSIVKVDPLTGRELGKWPVSGGAPTSLAALPAQGVVLFPAGGLLRVLDLDTGKVEETKFSAQVVATDPRQLFCYAFVREESVPTSGHLIINGRPIYFRSNHVDWAQTALYKYALFQKRPMLAELRLNAASNGRALHVSPDGQWVAVVGGGGWRPLDKAGHGAGYGVAVFTAPDLGQVQGFFETANYPAAVAVNPVTRQVVAVRADDAKIYHLGREKDPLVLKGPHGAAAAWSPDGRYLYLAGKSGLRAWPNTLSPQEEKVGVSWWNAIKPPQRKPHAGQEAADAAPIEAYKTFEIKSDRKETLAAIARAELEGRTRKPIDWMQYGPYQGDQELSAQFRAPVNRGNREESGLRIYQLKKLRETHESHPGIAFLLGMTYYFAGDFDKSEKELLTAIRLDQGRTSVTLHALRGLRQIRQRNGDYEAAAYCCAHVLQLDVATPRYLDEAKACFDQAKIGEAGEKLIQRGRRMALPAEPGRLAPGGKLPRLPVIAEGPIDSAEKIFAKAAPSVVLIRAGGSTGSGVCVAENGIILTNQHVVAGDSQGIRVYAYRYLNGKLSRLPPLEATVLYGSAEEDLAVLRVANPPSTLLPLGVAAAAPHEGAKVCAIGNPGLGAEVLEQTISEGIVSSAGRRLNGKTFVQHTAAVNPGNSGGPLLNERCQILGIITTKANLENVSFAIPAERIRDLFDSHGKPEETKAK